MKSSWMRSFALVVVVLALALAPLSAQSGEIPRLSNGKPNFNGIWQALNTANYDIEPHMARHAMQLREGPHGPLPAPKVLYLGAVGAVPGGMGIIEGGRQDPVHGRRGQDSKQENFDNWIDRDPEIKCFLPGVPRANYMPYPFQVFQNENNFFIAYEYANAVRDIYMEDPGEAPVDSWMGWSHGYWDGDTFEVKVTGQYAKWFDRSGNHHSDQMTVTERWTMIGQDHIEYEATIEDPQTFTRPWKIKFPLYRRIEENARLMDFRCVEFVEELMYGEWRRNPLPRSIP